MKFILGQTQDIACQESFVMRFVSFFLGGGGVLKYLHRGLLGFTGSLLKSSHYKCSQCLTLLQCLWGVMLSTFPPFGKYTVSMLGGCLLQGCHGWLCITLSWHFPHALYVDEMNNNNMWPNHRYVFGNTCRCLHKLMVPLLVKHESFNLFFVLWLIILIFSLELGEIFAAIGVRELQPNASEAFAIFSEAHRYFFAL